MRCKQSFNQLMSDPQWVKTAGAMRAAVRELNMLAPHPGRGREGGPAISLKANHRAAANAGNRDSMLATMMLDTLFGGAIGAGLADGLGLPEEAGCATIGAAVDIYDEYWTDTRMNRQAKQTTGPYELGEKKAISGGFNMTAARRVKAAPATGWDLYMKDLPVRRALEQDLAGMDRKLDRIQTMHKAGPAPG